MKTLPVNPLGGITSSGKGAGFVLLVLAAVALLAVKKATENKKTP